MKNLLPALLFLLFVYPFTGSAQNTTQPIGRPSVADSMFEFRDTVWGFRVLVPSKTVYVRQGTNHTGDIIMAHQYEYRDERENVDYIFGTNCLAAGAGITDDSIYLVEMKKELHTHFGRVDYDTTYRWGDYTIIATIGIAKESNRVLSIRYTFYGNRFYVQGAYYPDIKSTPRVTAYFRSFSILGLPAHPWQKAVTPDASFTTWAPAAFQSIPLSTSEVGPNERYVSYDSIHGNSFTIFCMPANPYYWSPSPQDLLKEKILLDFKDKDTLAYCKQVANGSLKGWEWAKRLGHSNIYLRERMLLNGDQFYYLMGTAPGNEVANPDANRFFNDFQSTRPLASAMHLFESKSTALLDALFGTDANAAEQAMAYVQKAPFTTSDLPLLHQRLLQMPPSSGHLAASHVNAAIRNCIIRVNDSSSFRFAADHYPTVSSEVIKENLLQIMEHSRTEAHYKEMAGLLVASPPSFVPFEVFIELEKNLRMTAVIMPQLLHFLGDSMARPFVTDLTAKMLDSNLITAAVVHPWHAAFLQYARHEINRLSTDIGDPRRFDYSLMTVLGVINTPEANADLREFFDMEFDDLRVKAFAALFRNGHQTNADIQTMASNKATRVELYHILRKAGRQSLFPGAFLNQQLFGQSMVYSELMKILLEPPASIHYVATRTEGNGAGAKKFYFYTCKRGKDDQFSLLACAGPYSPDPKMVVLPETKALVKYGVAYDPAVADQQMNTLIASY